MVQIPKDTKTVLPISDRGVRDIPSVAVDTSLERAFGEVGKIIEQEARQQQREEDTNFIYNSITDYNEKLIPVLEEERAKQGKDTAGNIERVALSSQTLRDEILEKAHPRVKDKLNSIFSRIDLGNETELSRLRFAGIKVEREQKRDRVLDTAKKTVLSSPDKALGEIFNISQMYRDEVGAGIITEEEARLKTEEAANELAVSAVVSIGEKFGPTAQLGMLKSGAFDDFISADQKEIFIKQATALEKAVENQKRIDADKAERDAEKALKEARDASEDDFFNRLDDIENPTTLAEIEQSDLEPNDKLKWRKLVEGNSKGQFLKTNWTRYNEIRTQLYTEEIANWTPAKINAEVKEGGIAIGGKGSESGAVELIATYNANIKPTKEKNPKLGIILKEVKSIADAGLFVEDFDPNSEADRQDNAVRHADMNERITDRVNKGEDASEVFLDEMKPIRDREAKTLLDRFIETIISPFVGEEEKKVLEEPDNQKAIEFLRRNNLSETPANIKLANERLKK